MLYSRQGTVDKVVAKIRELGKQGVQFAAFPETVIPYYPYFSFLQPAFAMAKKHLRLLEQSVTVPSEETRAIAEAFRDANLVVSIGVNERDGGSEEERTSHGALDGHLVYALTGASPRRGTNRVSPESTHG